MWPEGGWKAPCFCVSVLLLHHRVWTLQTGWSVESVRSRLTVIDRRAEGDTRTRARSHNQMIDHLITDFFSQHALTDKACVKTFDPKTTCFQECLITTFQDVYFVSESFEEAKEKMRWTLRVSVHALVHTLNTRFVENRKPLKKNPAQFPLDDWTSEEKTKQKQNVHWICVLTLAPISRRSSQLKNPSRVPSSPFSHFQGSESDISRSRFQQSSQLQVLTVPRSRFC